MAGSQGGGGNTSRVTTRSRAADRHVHVDDEENVFRGLGDIVNVGPNPPPLVHDNVVAEIGGIEDFVNLVDPLHQQIPSAIGGSNAVMSGDPVGEGNTASHGDGGNTSSGRRRSRRSRELNPPLIGGNLVNFADPNAFNPQIPAAIGGSEVAMAAAPIGEGDPIPNPPLVDENVPAVIEGSGVVAAPPIGEGGGGNTSRGTTRSRAADHVDDEQNVYGGFWDLDPNHPLPVDENFAAEIGGGGNFVNPADPLNAFPQQVPGAGDVMAAAPIAEGGRGNTGGRGGRGRNTGRGRPSSRGSSQNQQPKKRARINPVQNPPPPQPQQLLQQPPLPQHQPLPDPPAVHYAVDRMGGTPDSLKGKEQLQELCTKTLTSGDMNKLVITGRNKGFLIQEITRAGLALPLPVFATIVDGPTKIVELDRKENSDQLTLDWGSLVAVDGFRLVKGQLVDIWFDIDTEPSWVTIYINENPNQPN